MSRILHIVLSMRLQNKLHKITAIKKSVVYSRAAPKGAKSYLVLKVSIGGPAIGRALLLQTEWLLVYGMGQLLLAAGAWPGKVVL